MPEKRLDPELPTIIAQKRRVEGMSSRIYGDWNEDMLAMALGHAIATAFGGAVAIRELEDEEEVDFSDFARQALEYAFWYHKNREDSDVYRRELVRKI